MAPLGTGMLELLLVLLLAALAAAGGAAVFRDTSGERRASLLVSAAVSMTVGVLVLRFGAPASADLRGRLAAVLGGGAFGAGSAFAAAWLDATPEVASPAAAAKTVCHALALGGGAASVVLLCVGRGAPMAAAASTRALSAWAFGAAVTALALGASDLFALIALAVGVQTIGAVSGNVPFALGPLLAVLSSIAVLVGVAAVQADPADSPEAPWLRGFAVTTVVSTVAAASVSHWWTRGTGVVVAALAAAVGAVLTLLLGRYHDDPAHRPLRSLTEVRGLDATARWTTGSLVGLEGFLAVSAIATLVALAAAKGGELAGAASVGAAVAIGTALGTWGYLRALAGFERGRTVAHDTLLVVLIGAASALRSTFLFAAALLAVALMLGSAMLERVAAAEPEAALARALRNRSGTFTLLAALLLSGSATLASLRP